MLNKADKDVLHRRSSPPLGELGISILGGRMEELTCHWTLQCLVKYGFLKESTQDGICVYTTTS